MPSTFIPLIERYGLMNNLSASLLIQAFGAVRELPTDIGLSVNLSPSQLHDRSLPDFIQQTAEEESFDLQRLTLELTESALVDDLDLAGAVAADLKRLGIRLALDDFGTGYSSLLHLQSLPFDELKVDSSFVRSMVHSRQSRKITAGVISLGLSLGLRTVAEGIEEQSQGNLLAWQGCNLGQGFLYGCPMPAAELGRVLERSQAGLTVTAEAPASIADPFLALDAQPTERLSQLRAIYDGAPVGLAFLNRELRYVNLNQRLAQINGKSMQAHLGRKVCEMVDPVLYAQFEPYLNRALKGESLSSVEIVRTSAHAMMASYQPVRDEAGEILGVSVSIADISALKQKEEALRESEDHYRHTVELNPQIPWVTDAEGNTLSISSRWETFTGQTPEKTKDYGWLDVVHPDDKEHVLALVNDSLSTGAPMDMQYRVRSVDGKWIWMRSRGAPRRDGNGTIIRWYGSVESIDEHRRALDELRCSDARLRAIFQAAPVGIVLTDSLTGQVLSANPRAEQLIGFRFETGMVWSTEGWQVCDSSGTLLDVPHFPLTRAMRFRQSTEAQEFHLRRPDGSEIWLNITATPVCLDNGTQLGGVLVVQDVGSARREREQLLELARELTAMISGRSSESHIYSA